MNSTTARNARFVGRTIRLLSGLVALALVLQPIRGAALQSLLVVAGWFIAIAMFYGLLHWAVRRFMPDINRWLGAVLANGPAVYLILFGPPTAQIAALSYVGASLILDAISGDAGCEVMAFPGLILGHRTHLPCIAFSPIDWVEERVSASDWPAKRPAE